MKFLLARVSSKISRRFRAWRRYRNRRAELPGACYEIIGELFIPRWKYRATRAMIGDRQFEWLQATGDPQAQAKIARQVHFDVWTRCLLYVTVELMKHSIVGWLIQRGGR